MADSNDEGIGSTGTIPVDPSNPLYDAVKKGGGFVEDEDGNVTGGPDGDGTVRTEEERTSGSSGGSSSGSSGPEVKDTASNITEAIRKARGGRGDPGEAGGGVAGTADGDGESSGSSGGSSGGDSGRAARLLDGSTDNSPSSSNSGSGGGSSSGGSSDGNNSVRDRFSDQIVREETTPSDEIVGDSVDPNSIPNRTESDRSLVEQGRRQRDNETGEAFGGRREIERQLRSAASDFRGGVDDVASEVGRVARLGGSTFAASSPVTADDPAVAAGSDSTGSGTESAATGTVQGAGELVNLPQFAVTAIEAGELANAGISSAPVTGGSAEESQDFADRVLAAAAAQGADTVEAAQENPINFAGQLAGGAVVGGAASRVIRGARSSPSPDAPTNSQLGSRGTGSLLDADALDESMGVSGPSRRARVRGRVRRSDAFQAAQEQLERFRSDESAQLGRSRQREPEPDTQPERVDDRFRGFESEVRRAALEQREFGDFQDLESRQGINDPEVRQPRRSADGPERRRDRAQRSEVLQQDDLPDGADSVNMIGPTAGGATVGAVERTEAAQQPGLDVRVGPDDRLDVTPGQDSDVTPGSRSDTDQPPRSDTDQPPVFDTGTPPVFDFDQPPRSRESPPLLRRRTPGPQPDPTLRTPDTRRPLRRPDSDDDDDDQLDLFGGSGGLMADSGAVSGAATGFVAETLVGFGEGGLNIEAAQAADSADSGFLSTRAESDSSEGFEAARGLFSFGGDA